MTSPDQSPAGSARPPRERRLYRRYPVTLPVRLVCRGETLEGGLEDISLGGAAFVPGRPEWKGCLVRLHSSCFGHAAGFPARVMGGGPERLHLAFELDQEAEDALTMFLMLSAPSAGMP